MKNIACFDVGGTFIKYAVINSNGDILYKSKFPTPSENCRDKVPECISEKVKELKRDFTLYGIGISTAGQIDSQQGRVVFATDNLPGYTGAELSKTIMSSVGMKVYVENDVNAAALGEMWRGAGTGADTFVCITLGTGVGGAIIINRKLYKGVKGGAGELGHMTIEENGDPCSCGGAGCYERYASTSALLRNYLKQAKKQYDYVEEINGEKIMEKVNKREGLACNIYNMFIDHIVTGLINITYILDPGLIIIGGGISAQGKTFFDELNKRFKERVMESYGDHTVIVQAKLQNDAGIYGACYIAMEK